MMFRTKIQRLVEPWEGLPGVILSDVDDIRGDSAGLYLVRDQLDKSRLVPVAIQKGSLEQVGGSGEIVDHLAWERYKNTSIALVLDEFFYEFPEDRQ